MKQKNGLRNFKFKQRVKTASAKIFKILKKVMDIIFYYKNEKLVKMKYNIDFRKSFSPISVFPICVPTIGKKEL